MIDIQRRVSSLKYLLGVYPSVWQLPNSVKIYEYLEIEKGLGLDGKSNVLDLGCGRGLQTQLLARNSAHVTGIEPDTKRYSLAVRDLKTKRLKEKIDFVHGTLDDAKIEPESLDRAVSFCVLEHIPNLDDVLATIHTLLKKGGEIHATVDSLTNMEPGDKLEKHRVEHKVVQYFTMDTIEETLKRAGFTVFEKRNFLTSDLAKEKLLTELETDNYQDPAASKKEMVADLTEKEQSSPHSDRGTMILVRARKV